MSVLSTQFCHEPKTALESNVSICKPNAFIASMPISFLGNVITHLSSLSCFPYFKSILTSSNPQNKPPPKDIGSIERKDYFVLKYMKYASFN